MLRFTLPVLSFVLLSSVATTANAATAQRAVDLRPGDGSSYPSHPLVHDDDLYFTASPSISSDQLFRSDGTASGTHQLTAIAWPDSFSSIGDLFVAGSRVCFGAKGGLWASDGTTAGTALFFPDLVPRPAPVGTSPASVPMGGSTYFLASHPVSSGLWKTDGTVAGTQFVAPGGGGILFGVIGNRVLFTRSARLYASDGTPSSTLSLLATLGDDVNPLAVLGARLYFTRFKLGQFELWGTDGTAANTTKVTDLPYSGAGTPVPDRGALVHGGQLFFSYAFNGATAYRTDGTAAGTVQLGSTFPGQPFGVLGSRLFLDLKDPAVGHELFIGAQATATPTLLIDLTAGAADSVPGYFTPWLSEGKLAFIARTPDPTLFVTDGTTTTSLGMLSPMPNVSADILGASKKGLFLNGYDAAHGVELWFVPGTVTPSPSTKPKPDGGAKAPEGADASASGSEPETSDDASAVTDGAPSDSKIAPSADSGCAASGTAPTPAGIIAMLGLVLLAIRSRHRSTG